jgi:hypothetical protein
MPSARARAHLQVRVGKQASTWKVEESVTGRDLYQRPAWSENDTTVAHTNGDFVCSVTGCGILGSLLSTILAWVLHRATVCGIIGAMLIVCDSYRSCESASRQHGEKGCESCSEELHVVGGRRG